MGLSPSNPSFILFIGKVSNHNRVHVGGDIKNCRKKKKTNLNPNPQTLQVAFRLFITEIPGLAAVTDFYMELFNYLYFSCQKIKSSES